ncbi:MAG: FUSC family protein [Microbacterium sp.]|uniref:FUSC family protein n=1 Tax=Microbacterium sp. TaxID=51671 RepID=UPI002626CB1B|nr:FUSC family protein [Microbacterium sp.]MCX6502239.1 FUSC family protein [Microbacterium sp.]
MGSVSRRIGKDVIAVAPHRGAHRVALRAAFCVAVPLLVLWALGRLDLSVYATFGAFASLYGRHDSYPDRIRMQLAAAVTLLVVMLLGTVVAVLEAPTLVRIVVVALVAVVVSGLAQAARWHPPGALFAVFAAGAIATLPVDPGAFADVVIVGGSAAAFSVLVTVVIATARRGPRSIGPLRSAPWQRPDLLAAAGVGLGAMLAGLAGLALVGTHWYWAMVAAVAALGGVHVTARIVRGLQRLAGTLVGVLIAAGILALHLPPLVTIAVAVLCQAGAELFIGRNYGIAMLFVTPLALLMIDLAVPSDPAELLRDRVLDTVIGVVIGTVIAVLSARVRRRRPTA